MSLSKQIPTTLTFVDPVNMSTIFVSPTNSNNPTTKRIIYAARHRIQTTEITDTTPQPDLRPRKNPPISFTVCPKLSVRISLLPIHFGSLFRIELVPYLRSSSIKEAQSPLCRIARPKNATGQKCRSNRLSQTNQYFD